MCDLKIKFFLCCNGQSNYYFFCLELKPVWPPSAWTPWRAALPAARRAGAASCPFRSRKSCAATPCASSPGAPHDACGSPYSCCDGLRIVHWNENSLGFESFCCFVKSRFFEDFEKFRFFEVKVLQILKFRFLRF